MAHSRFDTASMASAMLVLVLLAASGCGTKASSCTTDADCTAREACISSGGVLFEERTCVDRSPTTRPTADAGGDVREPIDAGCLSQQDEEACKALDKECGTIGVIDACLGPRELDCGSCADGQTCGSPDRPNVCICTPEADDEFCERLAKNCGEVTDEDNCGDPRVVDCGECTPPAVCGGGGTENVCACEEQTDVDFCASLDWECDVLTATDACGQQRTVNCGTCDGATTCSGTDEFRSCAPDADGDGVLDDDDNCPTVENPTQANADGDPLGDACDVTRLRADGDTFVGDEPSVDVQGVDAQVLFVVALSFADQGTVTVQNLTSVPDLTWRELAACERHDSESRMFWAVGDSQAQDMNVEVRLNTPTAGNLVVVQYTGFDPGEPVYGESCTFYTGIVDHSSSAPVDGPGDVVLRAFSTEAAGANHSPGPEITEIYERLASDIELFVVNRLTLFDGQSEDGSRVNIDGSYGMAVNVTGAGLKIRARR